MPWIKEMSWRCQFQSVICLSLVLVGASKFALTAVYYIFMFHVLPIIAVLSSTIYMIVHLYRWTMIVQLTTGENGDVWELSQPVWCGVVHLTEAQMRLLRERIEQEYHVHGGYKVPGRQEDTLWEWISARLHQQWIFYYCLHTLYIFFAVSVWQVSCECWCIL